jgi:hypothetical protein
LKFIASSDSTTASQAPAAVVAAVSDAAVEAGEAGVSDGGTSDDWEAEGSAEAAAGGVDAAGSAGLPWSPHALNAKAAAEINAKYAFIFIS